MVLSTTTQPQFQELYQGAESALLYFRWWYRNYDSPTIIRVEDNGNGRKGPLDIIVGAYNSRDREELLQFKTRELLEGHDTVIIGGLPGANVVVVPPDNYTLYHLVKSDDDIAVSVIEIKGVDGRTNKDYLNGAMTSLLDAAAKDGIVKGKTPLGQGILYVPSETPNTAQKLEDLMRNEFHNGVLNALIGAIYDKPESVGVGHYLIDNKDYLNGAMTSLLDAAAKDGIVKVEHVLITSKKPLYALFPWLPKMLKREKSQLRTSERPYNPSEVRHMSQVLQELMIHEFNNGNRLVSSAGNKRLLETSEAEGLIKLLNMAIGEEAAHDD